MNKHSMKKMLRSFVCMVLIAAMALACMGCAKKEEPKTESPAASSGVQELGEGAKTFAFYMQDLDGTKQEFLIHTDADTVGAALVELELIEGEPGPYGMYVKKVCGITAVYEEDGTYWAFYENGEYGMTGVDQTNIDESVTYSMVKTEG
jgi:hypothetical protein